MHNKIYFSTLVFLFCLCALTSAQAQLSFSGQVRTRSELRDGQGTVTTDTIPAFFTSQRTRVNIGYSGYRFKVYASLQDVRVWGQDASSINRYTLDANDGLMLHEGWAEISLVDTGKVVKNFSVKIGRQELVYDDVRVLGNLDWLQQARRHDAVVFKFDHNGWMIHVAGAFNQNAERKANHIYNGVPAAGTYTSSTNGVGVMYKSMQFIYLNRKLHFGNASFLAFKDDFSKYTVSYAAADVDKKNPITTYGKGVNSRYTIGGNLFGTALRKINFALTAYYQTGKYRDGSDLGNQYLLSASGLYSAGRKMAVGPGVDYTTGNNGSDSNKKFQRFDPLYGTPHKFWGYMDYFYVADGFGYNGLIDYYLKSKYKVKDNMTLTADLHKFVLPNAIFGADNKSIQRSLGTELDLVLNYSMTKAITIEGGYSFMSATSTMTDKNVKPIKGTPEKFNDWAYVMISIKPAEMIVKPN